MRRVPQTLRCLVPVLVAGLALTACGGGAYETEQLTSYTRELERTYVDQAGQGQSAGDTEAFTAVLDRQPRGGDPIGLLDGVATITRTQTVRGQRLGHRVATIQYSLTGRGTIVAAGVYTAEIPGDASEPARQIVRPIVGGTDAFENARGKVVHTGIGGGQQKVTLDIETPVADDSSDSPE